MGRGSRRAHASVAPLLVVLIALVCVGAGLVYAGISSSGQPLSAPVPEAPFHLDTPPPNGSGAPPPTDLGPNTLAIPDLDIRTNLISTGFGANGSMILPPPQTVSHLTNGVEFGAPAGTNLIAGHVDDGDRTRGAMWALHQIRPGTPIYVADATGTMWTYRAVSLALYEKTALPPELFATDGAPRLVLVTCGGESVPDPYLPSGFTYNDNVVVTAVPA